MKIKATCQIVLPTETRILELEYDSEHTDPGDQYVEARAKAYDLYLETNSLTPLSISVLNYESV